jgi:hypothetical protein
MEISDSYICANIELKLNDIRHIDLDAVSQNATKKACVGGIFYSQ